VAPAFQKLKKAGEFAVRLGEWQSEEFNAVSNESNSGFVLPTTCIREQSPVVMDASARINPFAG
jgi:hypothetical protein